MLPAIVQEEGVYPVPQFKIERTDIEGFLDELRGFHTAFRECFARSEPRESFLRYMLGQFSALERKSIEPIALHIEGANVRCMQNAITDAQWDEERMLSIYHGLVHEDLADPSAVLMFDESGFPKKGEDSAGVAMQYCGNAGGVANSQVGVFAGYASRHGYALLDKRLFVPDAWFDNDHAEKRHKLDFPEGLTFKSKPQLAVEMFKEVKDRLPFKYVVADSIYGESDDFLKAIGSHVGMSYFVQVSSGTLFWLQAPATETRTYRRKGELRSKRIVPKTEKHPMRVDAFARSLHEVFWYRRTVSEGSKGPIDYEFARRRITICRRGVPQRTVWLVIKRNLNKRDRRYWFYISNAPLATMLSTFVWLSGIRWAIEQCFEETKTELGMDHYEVRKFTGWNHHIMTCILAHFFLWHLRIRLGKKSSSHYAIAA